MQDVRNKRLLSFILMNKRDEQEEGTTVTGSNGTPIGEALIELSGCGKEKITMMQWSTTDDLVTTSGQAACGSLWRK